MRLVLLGPVHGDAASLARVAHVALEQLAADRVVYLGVDGCLDAVVAAWAGLLSVVEPLTVRLQSLLEADVSRLRHEFAREYARKRLWSLQTLAGRGVRSIEVLHDRIVLLAEDKAGLNEEDLLPASVIVYGRGEPTLRRIGSRLFASPGTPCDLAQGILVLDEIEGQPLHLVLCDAQGRAVRDEYFEVARPSKLRVQGEIR